MALVEPHQDEKNYAKDKKKCGKGDNTRFCLAKEKKLEDETEG